jgi:saccharopine dehydrogenase-like NADP-dependent oxidoreductase
MNRFADNDRAPVARSQAAAGLPQERGPMGPVGDRRVQRIAVLGLGNVGALIAEMLRERGYDVQGVDADGSKAVGAPVTVLDVSDASALARLLKEVDAVVSCLPYHLVGSVATLAHAAGVHYFDLTEDINASRLLRQLAETSTSLLMPHCGLAPGFICVVGASLAARLDAVEHLALRVGALPATPTNALGYAFNWSPAGVVNEYLNDCEQLRGGRRVVVPPLGDVETLTIEGTRYEAFTTSGGLGTMCETYLGRVDRLDYKTIRYPGHCQLMAFLLHELGLAGKRDSVQQLLADAYPPVPDDVVVVSATAAGVGAGREKREELVRLYRPQVIAGEVRTAIAWTTAAGAVAMVELLAGGALPTAGFVRQEDVPLDLFMSTSAGQLLVHDSITRVGLPVGSDALT